MLIQPNRYGRAGGGVAGSVVFGGSFAGSEGAGAGVLGGGGDVLGATLGFSGGGALPDLETGWSHAVRPSGISNVAAKVNNFMVLLSLEIKVLGDAQFST
jgi:hypothetical protein